jgi:hypothetical protein
MASSTTARRSAAPACRRFRFAFADARRRDVAAKRTAAVAEYVDAWLDAAIVDERRLGSECLVTVEVGRPVPVDAVERFCRECPYYVRHSFSAADGERRSSPRCI